MAEGVGHEIGFQVLTFMLLYCYDLDVKHVTVYAFGIDNFQRKPKEVQMRAYCQKQVRVHIAGNLELFNPSLRDKAKRLMQVTAGYSKAVFTVCFAYTSTDEIVHAVREPGEENCKEIEDQTKDVNLNLVDIEKRMYMAIAPDPDILIRTAGKNRLTNFLLWQSCNSQLVSTAALWPEIGLWHSVCAVLNFQRNRLYLEKKKKQM